MLSRKDIILFYTRAKLEDDIVENYMGFFWWLLDPILSAMVYYVVFDLILHRGRHDYIPFLFIGIIVWKWFQTTIKNGTTAISSQKALYKKVFLPKIIFPWVETGFTSVKFLFAIGIVIVVYPFLGYTFNHFYVYLPILILCQFVFTLGLATFFAALTPFFPDFNMLITHILRLAFYPSGIIFAIDRVPERYRWIMEYNPMAQAISSYRNIIMHNHAPSYMGMLLLIFVGVTFYIFGALAIKKFEGRYAKLL